MNLIEKIFSKTILKCTKSFTSYGVGLLLFQPKSKIYTGEEWYPVEVNFNMYQYGDVFIGKMRVVSIKYDLELKKHTPYVYENEVRMDGISKSRQVIANKLLKEAYKKYFKPIRGRGYKECLLDYLYVIEYERDLYRLELDTVYSKFNKFRSIRKLILD